MPFVLNATVRRLTYAGKKSRRRVSGTPSPAQFSLTKTRGKQTILAKFVLTDECLHLRFTAAS
jgi:hypothetical protein